MKLFNLINAIDYGHDKVNQLHHKLSTSLSNSNIDEAHIINNQIIRLKQAMHNLEECEIENCREMYEQLVEIFQEIDGD